MQSSVIVIITNSAGGVSFIVKRSNCNAMPANDRNYDNYRKIWTNNLYVVNIPVNQQIWKLKKRRRSCELIMSRLKTAFQQQVEAGSNFVHKCQRDKLPPSPLVYTILIFCNLHCCLFAEALNSSTDTRYLSGINYYCHPPSPKRADLSARQKLELCRLFVVGD